jgi:hypothetical protein
MDERIDPDLFARLMLIHASARKDLLEYMGQGPVVMPAVLPPKESRAPKLEGNDPSSGKP